MNSFCVFRLSWNFRATERGFNLVEIIVALAISVVAIVSIMGIFPLILQSVRETDNETKAGMLAQSIFTTLRSHYFDDVNLFGTTINLATANNTLELYAPQDLHITTTPGPNTAFLIRLKFNNNPPSYPGHAGNMNHVSLAIYWSPPQPTVGSPPVENTNCSTFTGLIAKTTTRP